MESHLQGKNCWPAVGNANSRQPPAVSSFRICLSCGVSAWSHVHLGAVWIWWLNMGWSFFFSGLSSPRQLFWDNAKGHFSLQSSPLGWPTLQFDFSLCQSCSPHFLSQVLILINILCPKLHLRIYFWWTHPATFSLQYFMPRMCQICIMNWKVRPFKNLQLGFYIPPLTPTGWKGTSPESLPGAGMAVTAVHFWFTFVTPHEDCGAREPLGRNFCY